MSTPRLSACLIVKDEAEHLPRCLASLQGVVDEIVVVDTGSSDDTVAIATAAGARVGHFAWSQSFADARNAALELATGDWVLVIDADEELVLADRAALDALLAGPPAAYLLPLYDVALGRAEGAAGQVLRLFPRHSELRYQGRLHEGIGSGLAALGWPLVNADALRLVHHGYLPEVMARRGKPARNLELAELDVAEHPEAPHLWFNFARTALTMNRLDLALEAWNKLRGFASDADPYMASYPRELASQFRQRLALLGAAVSELSTPRLTACMIVKNEATQLPRCLASLRGLVDELIVVDTGSTDDTVAIAEAAGARIGRFAWCDDFAAARNASLALATGDWVLVIDADEELVVPDVAAFRQALAAPEAHAYLLEIQNLDADGIVESRLASAPRLFRANPAVRFAGRLHEDIGDSLLALGHTAVRLPGIALRHHGYTPAMLVLRDKVTRNRRLATLQVDETPADPNAWFDLAAITWMAKDPFGTLDALQEVQGLLARGGQLPPHRHVAMHSLEAFAADAIGNRDRAMRALDRGLQAHPGHPELAYERGHRLADAGRVEEAIADFEACLAAKDHQLGGTLRAGTTGFMVHAELASLYQKTQRLDRAVHHLEAASLDPSCPPGEAAAMRELASRLKASAKPAPQPAASAPKVTKPSAWRITAPAGQPKAAPARTRQQELVAALTRNPRDASAFLELGLLSYQDGQLDKALVAIDQALRLDATASGYYLLGAVLAGLDQPVLAGKAFGTALQVAPSHPSALQARLAVRGKQPEAPPPDALVQRVDELLALSYPRLSACLIVRDEAKNLPRCLASLQGVVDEIIVVDTGSTDDTVAIAEAAGATVGHFAWCDDFAAARNASIELATGDWILAIDADEELVVNDLQALRTALLCRTPGGYAFDQVSVDGAGNGLVTATAFRLFQRLDGLRFRGRIHESIEGDLQRLGLEAFAAPFLWLRHVGYTPDALQGHQKPQRNARLAELAVQDEPTLGRHWVALAAAYLDANEVARAAEAFENLDRHAGGLEALTGAVYAQAIRLAASIERARGRFDAALRILDDGLKRHPGYPELLFERGQTRAQLGDTAGAREEFLACTKALPETWENLPVRAGITTELPRLALEQLGVQPAQAAPVPTRQQELVAALTRNPRDASAFLELGLLSYQDGQLDKALVAIDQALRLDATASGYYLLGAVLAGLDQPMLAGKAFGTVLQVAPSHPSALQARLAVRGKQPEAPPPDALVQRVDELLALSYPRLSACLIVRDEAKNLPRCLASLQGVVDEIIVVDTGSTDDTVAIAEAAGAMVGHFAWCDDFAAARNASIELATGDWILAIDADEELVVNDPQALRDALLMRSRGGYLIQLANVGANGEQRSVAPLLRLFQRQEGLRYQGRLHESLMAGMTAGGWQIGTLAAASFVHHGYEDEIFASRDKAARNLQIARIELEEHYNDPERWLNLARCLSVTDAREECIEVLTHIERTDGWVASLPDSHYAVFVFVYQEMLRTMGRFEEADRVLTLGLQRLPGYPDFLFDRGNVRYRLGREEEAIADFKACLRPFNPFYASFVRPGVTNELPHLALAQIEAARPGGRLSACLIVKNEAKNLPRCLASLRGVVDEIVVVDTGSTDDTVAIAEAAGARTGHFAWCDDFAAARNASLALATGDWVLVIDADEELVVPDVPAFRQALRRQEVAGYIFPIHNQQDDGSHQVSPMLRLFRNRPDVRFSGRLHEEVARSMERLGLRVEMLDGPYLDHDGYRSGAIADRQKWARNLQIAIAEAEANPQSALAWYNLGRSSLFTGQREPAIAAFEQVRRLLAEGAELGEAPYCTFMLLSARLKKESGQAAEAEALLTVALARVPGFPEFHYERGLLRAQRGDDAGARQDFEACLRGSGRRYTGAVRAGVVDELPRRELSKLAGVP